jgi:hypothetical protein
VFCILSAQSSSWSQFRGTANLSGVSAERLDPPLRVLWTYAAGESVESSAAISGDVAYVGSMSGELHAIGLRDGKARWKYRAAPADRGIGESSPAVSGGLVYIGDLAGVLHAVDASTGKAAWTFKTNGEIKSSPVVAGGTVLIGSYDGHLYGLDAKTGKERWKVMTENYVHATPAVVNGIAYFGGCDEVCERFTLEDLIEGNREPSLACANHQLHCFDRVPAKVEEVVARRDALTRQYIRPQLAHHFRTLHVLDDTSTASFSSALPVR